MKKTAALFLSVLLYIGTFLLTFWSFIGDNIRWFLLGFPVIIAVYFVIVGNLFARHLQLNRWSLWLSMNFIGGLCSWMILLVCFPSLLMNGMILFLVGAFVGIFAVVWALMGMVFFVRKV